jgi:integrase
MATKRERNGVWQYTIRRKGMLDKPLYYSFDSEAAGDVFCARLEASLDKGVIPAEIALKTAAKTLSDLIRDYKNSPAVSVAPADSAVLSVVDSEIGNTKLAALTYEWVERWVERLKEKGLAPSTIQHKVGSLARAIDWSLRREYAQELMANPLRLLPRGYAVGVRGNVERDRRLEPGEEARILEHLSGAHRLLFVLALETAMRMAEIYSLTPEQVDLRQRTVFLDKTKNGDKRQVPLSSVACRELQGFDGFGFGPRGATTTSKLSVYFGRVFEKAGCPDLRFHDLRHEATCRLFERTRLSDLQIAKITGHKDPRMLARYANLRGSDLAQSLW